jgi:hypothetical protein
VLAAYRSSTDGVCYSLAPGQGVRAARGAAMSREAIAAMPPTRGAHVSRRPEFEFNGRAERWQNLKIV